MKDYYRVLGVLPSCEDIVIRAAYRVLAQRYHPDRWEGSKEEATKRMADINDAYAVLSDAGKRRQYDKERAASDEANTYDEHFDNSYVSSKPLESDWSVAVKYYPDLAKIVNDLGKVSERLSFTYRTLLLERKDFERRLDIAKQLEKQFLQLYFGTNEEIIAFARQLILANNKAAAKAVNEAVRVLGSNVAPEMIIKTIWKDFDLGGGLWLNNERREQGQQILKKLKEHNTMHIEDAMELIRCVGGQVEEITHLLDASSFACVYQGVQYKFAFAAELVQWVKQSLVPRISKA